MFKSSEGKSRDINLAQSWKSRLSSEFDLEYMKELRGFLIEQKKLGKNIYPPGDQIFNALNKFGLFCPLALRRVAI